MKTRAPEEALLTEGHLEIVGALPHASNYTLLAKIKGPVETAVVYKPRYGETPLWDFPYGTLCMREVAAFKISESGGFDLVPPTVLRDGPLGLGSVQLFIEHDPNQTAFELAETNRRELRRVALFDLVTNNADRKAGHVFKDRGGKLWAVDHGICFHSESKLRSVLWDFVGERFTDGECGLLNTTASALQAGLDEELTSLISPRETAALTLRVSRLLELGKFPQPGPGRHYPWPPV